MYHFILNHAVFKKINLITQHCNRQPGLALTVIKTKNRYKLKTSTAVCLPPNLRTFASVSDIYEWVHCQIRFQDILSANWQCSAKWPRYVIVRITCPISVLFAIVCHVISCKRQCKMAKFWWEIPVQALLYIAHLHSSAFIHKVIRSVGCACCKVVSRVLFARKSMNYISSQTSILKLQFILTISWLLWKNFFSVAPNTMMQMSIWTFSNESNSRSRFLRWLSIAAS